MSANWDGEMQEMFDRLQRALSEEFRTQFTAMGAQLEARLEQRLAARIDTRLEASEARLEQRLEASEARLEQRLGSRLEARLADAERRLGHHLRIQAEELREIVRTAADNYGGVLVSIRAELADFRQEWRNKSADTDLVLLDHAQRIVALEHRTGGTRE